MASGEVAREEVARLVAQGDRVAQALPAMDDHPGHALLRGAELTGASKPRWERTRVGMVRLLSGPVVVLPERPAAVRTPTGSSAVADPLTPDPAARALADRVRGVVALHAGFDERVAAPRAAVAEVAAAHDQVQRVRARVVAEIMGDHPRVPSPDGLGGTLEGLRRRFPEVREGEVAGLLERRAELVGRLDAYRAKAARSGFAEDAEPARLHRRALGAAPCDLQRAVLDRTETR